MASKTKRVDGDKYCGAQKKDETTCKALAGAGTDHKGTGRCKFHGGSAPSGKVAAALEFGRLEAARWLASRPEIDISPEDALEAAMHDSVLLVEVAKQVVAGAVEQSDEEALAVAMESLESAVDRQAAISKAAVAAGIAERRVKQVERQGEMVMMFARALLTALGLDFGEHTELVIDVMTSVADSPELLALAE